jgi:hypothetical protein
LASGHGGYYLAFVGTLFLTGMRPSEAVALRVADMDLNRKVLRISKSRNLKEEAATKTSASDRTIPIGPGVIELLRPLVDKRARTDYLFTNLHGGPIDQAEWPKDHWHRCLEGLDLRHRKFYATRHTFISLALTAGANLFAIAEYCGTSVQMIQQSYGKYMPADRREILKFISGQRSGRTASVGAKTQPPRSAVAFWPRKPMRIEASLTITSWNQPQRDLVGTRSSSGCAKWTSCARQWRREAHRCLTQAALKDASEPRRVPPRARTSWGSSPCCDAHTACISSPTRTGRAAASDTS